MPLMSVRPGSLTVWAHIAVALLAAFSDAQDIFDCAPDCSGRTFENITIDGANLAGVNFTGSTFSEILITGDTNLQDADFSNTTWNDQSVIDSARLTRAKFVGADIAVLTIRKRDSKDRLELLDVDFTDAVITSLEMSEVSADRLNLSGATVGQLVIFKSGVQDAVFDEAEVGLFSAREANLARTSFAGATIKDLDANFVEMGQASFDQSSLSGIIDGYNLANASFVEADLQGIQFGKVGAEGGDLRDADFSGADLLGVLFTGVDLEGADFSGADLTNADFSNADLDMATFNEETNIVGTNFTGADTTSAEGLMEIGGPLQTGSPEVPTDRPRTTPKPMSSNAPRPTQTGDEEQSVKESSGPVRPSPDPQQSKNPLDPSREPLESQNSTDKESESDKPAAGFPSITPTTALEPVILSMTDVQGFGTLYAISREEPFTPFGKLWSIVASVDGAENASMALIQNGNDEFVVVDTGPSVEFATAAVNFVSNLVLDMSIAAVFLTNELSNKVGGVPYFTNLSVDILTLESVIGRMSEPEGVSPVSEGAEFTFGELVLSFSMILDGTTESALLIEIAAWKAIVAGDTIFNKNHYPVSLKIGLARTIAEAIADMDPVIIVPGHGVPGPRSIAIDFQSYLADAIATGTNSETADVYIAAMEAAYPDFDGTNTLTTSAEEATFPLVLAIPATAGPSESLVVSVEDDAACFPGSATVELSSGEFVRMSDLQIGHKVLSSVEERIFSDVYFFSHRDSAISKVPFLDISLEDGVTLSLSTNHYLYAARDAKSELRPARSLKPGDKLLGKHGNAIVRKIGVSRQSGLFNPHTLSGDIVVNGVLTSTYTATVPPALAHAMLLPIKTAYLAGFSVPGFLDFDVPAWITGIIPSIHNLRTRSETL